MNLENRSIIQSLWSELTSFSYSPLVMGCQLDVFSPDFRPSPKKEKTLIILASVSLVDQLDTDCGSSHSTLDTAVYYISRQSRFVFLKN